MQDKLDLKTWALFFVGVFCIVYFGFVHPALTTNRFTDPELGISFVYPSSWGNVTTQVNVSIGLLTKTLAFTNEPSIRLTTTSNALMVSAETLMFIDQENYVTYPDCNRYLSDRTMPVVSKAYDVEGLNATFHVALCSDMTREFLFKIQNPLYQRLLVTHYVNQNTAVDFEYEINDLVESLKIHEVSLVDAHDYFLQHFSAKLHYIGDGYQYEYPNVFINKALNIQVTTKHDAIALLELYKKEKAACETNEGLCYPIWGEPELAVKQWDDEIALFQAGNIGVVPCPARASFDSLCEMLKVGDNLFLKVIERSRMGELGLKKHFIAHHNDLRYELSLPDVYSFYVDDKPLASLTPTAADDIYKEILESFTFTTHDNE